MPFPMVTIVVPVLNRVSDLPLTLDSIVALGGSVSLDCIVVDGGSSDGTLDVIKNHELNVRWVSRPDRGVYDAMNTGWSMADPDSYVLFLGAGDRIISLPRILTNPPVGEVVCGEVDMGRNRRFMPKTDWRLKIYNSLHHQALLVPKSIHPVPPFDLRFSRYADFDFNQRLLKMGTHFCIVPGFKAEARPGGISDLPDFGESLRVIYKNYGCFWCLIAMSGFIAVAILPFLRRFTSLERTVC